jgi:hypothetical protein
MKWLAQVAHVARKDLLMTRWYVAGYAALVAIASAAALDFGPGLNPLWPLLVWLLATICVWVIIQTDSPYRSEAFWASKPLSATGVFAGKVLYIILIMTGIGLAGQVIVLLIGFRLDARDFTSIVLASALGYGSSLLGATVIASMTPDVRSVILIYIANFVFMNTVVMYFVLKRTGGDVVARFPMVVGFLVFAATQLLIAQVYRARSRRLGIWLFVITSLLSPLVVLTVFPVPTVAPSTSKAAPAQLQAADFSAWRTNVTSSNGDDQFYVYGQLSGGSPHHAYVVVDARVEVEGERGTTLRIPVTSPIFLNRPLAPNVDGVRWIQDAQPPVYRAGMNVRVSRRQVSALSSPSTRVALRARIEILEPRISAPVPLVRGTVAVSNRQRLKVLSTYPGDLRVAASRIAQHSVPDQGLKDFGSNLFEYALISRPFHEAVALKRKPVAIGSALVITGGGGSRETVQLTTEDVFRRTSFEPGMDWLASAELLRIEWRSLGSYPVTVDLPLDPNM